jgi:glycosyltransferase involved in cell wall biosynthesis
MLISVITPTFNSGAFIRRNIDSVNSQTHPEIEHLFIDNLSKDDTAQQVREHSKRNAQFLSEKDAGISDAFNKGLRAARGEIIAILNSDDEFYDSLTLSRVVQAFAEDSSLDFVFGSMKFIDPTYGTNVRQPLQCPITHAMPYNHPSFFVRRRFYDQLGVFDLEFRYAMDFELISRMYSSPTQTKLKGKYLGGDPLSIMHAGGASWAHEIKAMNDIKKALIKNGLWNQDAENQIRIRTRRVQLKTWLSRLGLSSLVKVWRHFKWKNT